MPLTAGVVQVAQTLTCRLTLQTLVALAERQQREGGWTPGAQTRRRWEAGAALTRVTRLLATRRPTETHRRVPW
jgi:hypothetical protein